ncbi:hypothetical protein LJC59_00820, partial [Desulfovibrio sp. OttesenSCG-928-A18]|nr:hypothetical protein [Desulfovibrio sp. OttesenSCG-928-A18]
VDVQRKTTVESGNCGDGFARLDNAFNTGLEGLARHGGNGDVPGRDGADKTGPVAPAGGFGGMADSEMLGCIRRKVGNEDVAKCTLDCGGGGEDEGMRFSGASRSSRDGRLEHTSGIGRERREETEPGYLHDGAVSGRAQGEYGPCLAGSHRILEYRPGPTNGFWRDPDWLFCRDGKWRPVRSGTFALAHGAPARVVRLRGYGDAINAEAARAFIKAAMEYLEEQQ